MTIASENFLDPWPPDPPTPVTYYTTLTVVCAAHGFTAGRVISITGCSLYNSPAVTVTEVIDANTFKVAYYSTDSAVGAGGNATPLGASVSRVSNIATAKTSAAHGFYPGLRIAIAGIANSIIGGGIAAIARVNNRVTVTTTTPTGLTAGCTVQIGGVTTATFNGTFEVSGIIDTLHFTYEQTGADATDATGNVYDIWAGLFYVTTVPTSTTFTYKQIGPNNQTTTAGTATPTGQIEAGRHTGVLIFQTRQGSLTAPSPPFTFFADGSKHVLINNIPLGPDNVIARIFAFTGTDGGNYFYIPVPAAVAGQQVSSSTVVNDNTTTSALFDFSDNTLLAATPIDVAGNNLFAQVVLGPCINVQQYASRMFWLGDVNKVQNLYNMGFEGGYNSLTAPLGWAVEDTGGILVTSGDVGQAWQITGRGTGRISQTCYRDPYGARVLLDDTQYSVHLWAQAQEQGQQGSIVVEIYDTDTATVLATAEIQLTDVSLDGAFVQADFDHKTPVSLPVTAVLRVYADNLALGKTVILDELEIVYTDRPYLNNVARASYVGNPEAFDGVTGNIGPANDESALLNLFNIRDNLYLLSDKLFSTKDLQDQEPSTWQIAQVAEKCGSISPFGLDSGEDWAVWATQSGMRIFSGQQPDKISQEIQTRWALLNTAVQHKVWVTNDAASRRVYVGMPTGLATAPDKIYVLDYRELDSAEQISNAAPTRVDRTGQLRASDISRKWTIWNLKMNCASILQREGNDLQFCMGAGNGQILGTGTGFGNVYALDPEKFTDDDFGALDPYYTTFFFVDHDTEAALQLGSYEKLYVYMSMFISGIGLVSITPLANSLENEWMATPEYPLSLNPTFDFEWGLNVTSERCAFRINVAPITDTEAAGYTNGTDVYFNTGQMVISMKQNAIVKVRGAI